MDKVYIADGVKIIGKVNIGEGSSIWYNSVLRGDINSISIGKNSNVQDNSVIHVTRKLPVKIGEFVTIGHGALVHGSIVEDNVLIGMGAIVLDGCKIGKNSIIGAGTLLLENTHIPEGSLVVGSPGKVIRQLSQEEIQGIKDNALNYVELTKKNLNK